MLVKIGNNLLIYKIERRAFNIALRPDCPMDIMRFGKKCQWIYCVMEKRIISILFFNRDNIIFDKCVIYRIRGMNTEIISAGSYPRPS